MPLLFQYIQTKLLMYYSYSFWLAFFLMYFEAGSKMYSVHISRGEHGDGHRGSTLWTRPALRWDHHRHRPHPTEIRGSYLSGWECRTLSIVPCLRLHYCTESWNILPCWTGTWIPGWVIAADVASGSWRTALGGGTPSRKAKIPKNVSKNLRLCELWIKG